MIKQIRQELGLSQEELGDAVGQTQASISNYESGKRPIGKTLADKLIELCGEKGIEKTYNDIFSKMA